MAEYTLEPINDEPEYTLEPVETRQAPKSTLWGSINNIFPENTGAEAAKAANSLVYSDMLNIAPSVAYEYHDEIDRQVQDKLGKNRGVLQSAFESSIIGMMVRQKVPEPFESASQAERWIQGTLAMLFDIPTFMAGYVIGGGNPISGTAGAFGFHSGLRKILMDRYSKGEARDALEWFERTGNAIKETIKGEVIGGFVGGVGYMAPVWGGAAMRPLPSKAWKGLLELSTMTTAGKLVEGQLPTTQDLIDNAGILLAMHAGIKGVEAAKSRIPEVRRKLQEVYVETGVHPKEIKDTIINERLNPQEDVIDTIDRVAQDIKKDLPPEPPQPPEKPPVAPVPEKPIPSIKEAEKPAPEPITEARGAKESPLETTTSIKNAAVDAERKAAGLEPIESPVNKRSMPETMEEVRAKVDSGEINPRELARKINNIVELGERPEQYNNVTTKDALLYDKVRIENEQRGITDKYENPESMRRWLELQEAYDANQRATKALASEWGYTGLAMQQEMSSDYSLSAMLRRAKEDGVDTTNPEVIKKYEKLSSEIEKATKQFLKRKERQIAEYERRLQEGDFSKQTREPRELSQEELDAQFKVDQKKREYEKARLQDMLAQRGTKKVVTDSIVEAMLLVKAIKSAYDVSAPGRQGFFALISHPILGFKNIAEMFRALRSEEVVFRIHKEIQGRKNAKLYKEAEVPFTDTEGKIATAEEMFMGRWQEYIPGIPASNRAFVAFLNLMRADLFDAMYKYSFERRGVKATKEELLALGDYVAQATGRGTIKKYESALQEAGKVLWAPKLVVSRFQMLTGKGLLYGRGTAATRKAVAREYARILGGLAIIYSVDYLVNTTPVETDPTSSDFGKIIVGKTRIDVLAGVSQATVLLGRLGYGESKNIRTGRITPIRGENIPYGGQDSWDVMMRFMRTKLTPVLGIAINLATEKDLIGKKYGWEDVPADLTVPLAMRDIYEAMQEEGIPAGLALGTLGMFGVGLQTHEDKRFSR